MSVTESKILENNVRFKDDFLKNYLCEAPIALAVERALECEIMSQQKYMSPVLDIGCGEGLFAYTLFDQKIDCGIDPNQKEIDRAKEYDMYNELICCCGNKIPKEDGSYNTIFSNSVLEHIQSLMPVLKEAHRLLSLNGSFFITIPTNRFDHYTWISLILTGAGLKTMAKKYRKFFNNFWKHYHFYTEEEWTKMFDEAGFRVEKSVVYDPKSICLFNNVTVPFAIPSLIMKRLTNRRIIIERFRELYSKLFFKMINPYVEKHRNEEDGGLIFFHLKKKTH